MAGKEPFIGHSKKANIFYHSNSEKILRDSPKVVLRFKECGTFKCALTKESKEFQPLL